MAKQAVAQHKPVHETVSELPAGHLCILHTQAQINSDLSPFTDRFQCASAEQRDSVWLTSSSDGGGPCLEDCAAPHTSPAPSHMLLVACTSAGSQAHVACGTLGNAPFDYTSHAAC